jgi:hypothetical protein
VHVLDGDDRHNSEQLIFCDFMAMTVKEHRPKNNDAEIIVPVELNQEPDLISGPCAEKLL